MEFQLHQPDNFETLIIKGNHFDFETSKQAITRINEYVQWQQDTQEIIDILKDKPKYCYFAIEDGHILGYAILRKDGPDEHLHVSWIATDVQKKGVGTKLMHAVIEKNKKLGKKILSLHHNKDNHKIASFYNKIAELESMKITRKEISEKEYYLTYLMLSSNL